MQTTTLIIRHGEKPALGFGQLDCRGLNRSLALAPLLLARYGRPQAIYAPNPAQLKTDKGVAYAYVRPLATVEPLAVRAGLPIGIEWGMTEVDALASHLAAAGPGVRVVAWEHHWAETLARRLLEHLGGDPAVVPTWADDDFDSIYVIRSDAAGARFSRERQGLDGLPETCPAPPAPSPN